MELRDLLIADLRNRVDVPAPNALREICALLSGAQLLQQRSYVRYALASAVASKIITCSASGGAPNDTLVIGGTTLTNKTTPANESEFADAATDALLAASVVACINAHSVLSKIVWAAVTTSASGIITVYCKHPGPIGNLVTLAETGNGFTLGGAALASGASDEVDELQLGYSPSLAVAG
jgi:hypothetical protein